MFRFISLFLRKRKSIKNIPKSIEAFEAGKQMVADFPMVATRPGTLLIIRLDDIGDYILFRNTLNIYRHSSTFKNYQITLLGNIAWKSLFEKYDAQEMDRVIWLDKTRFNADPEYRKSQLTFIRNQGFAITVCPEKTRPILLTDLFTVAADSPERFGGMNTNDSSKINAISNDLYHHVFNFGENFVHEFIYNLAFANWVNGTNVKIARPSFPLTKTAEQGGIICAIGASLKSKRWPIPHWIKLIHFLQKKYHTNITIIGGKGDSERAKKIQTATSCLSLVGQEDLAQTISTIAQAALLITNDSFALHAAVAVKVPHILAIANGNNAFRFCDYQSVEGAVQTVYPTIYLKNKVTLPTHKILFYETATVDIYGISEREIIALLPNKLPKIKVG